MNRKQFLKYTAILTAGVLSTGLYTWQVEPFWLEFVHRQMKINNLPKELIGKTVMQISDIHVGDRFDYQFIIDSFVKAQKLNPDYVVYTGDYISYRNSKQKTQLKEVLKYVVKGRIGTLGILGNHDYGHNWSQNNVADDISTILSTAGIDVLRNQQKGIDGLNFIGLDDYWATNFHPSRITKKIDNSQANLLLCHNPDVCDLNVWNGYQGWILAGHTHGGQCKPPFLTPPMLPVKNKEYSAGEIDLKDGRTLYINRALGHLWQVRFNVRPEITVFTLTA
ncbi:MAG: putative MPP superfamily phosphohydrolase [Saprospiraceae bacterium]|jgi:predicted MPP superfamily phosphohydrolase